MVLFNPFAVSLLEVSRSVNAGVECKQKVAGWNDNYLIQRLLNTSFN